MFFIPKKIIFAFLLLLLLLTFTFWFGRIHDLEQAKKQADQQVSQLNNYIDNELARFAAESHNYSPITTYSFALLIMKKSIIALLTTT